MKTATRAPRLFGAPVPRREDTRLLRGEACYTGDVRLPGQLTAAFLRSPHAHARILGVDTSEALAMPGVHAVLTGAEAAQLCRPLRAVSELPTYRPTDWPVLAHGKVRFCGEAVAAVVAESRYLAEDALQRIRVEYAPLPAVVDVEAALAVGSPRVHEELDGNVIVYRQFKAGDVAAAEAQAAGLIRERFVSNRHSGVPMEGRAAVAAYDPATQGFTLYLSTQVPHLARKGLADVLGVPEHHIRVIAPDVGGGFGIKASLYPEEIVLCLLACRLRRPVQWVEDRREHLLAAAHGRDQIHDVVAAYSADGRILSVRDRILCDCGAYGVYPWTAGIEPLMAGGLLLGPYKVDHYYCEAYGVATTKTPSGPYRGVARPATTFVMERIVDLVARATGLDPAEVRRRNLIQPGEIPYTSATRVVHDSAAYLPCLEQALALADYEGLRREQAARRAEGRYLGIGIACYNELTGMGSAASAGPRMPMRTGHEAATVRFDPSGKVTVLMGVTSQGQGLETTMAQLVADTLTLPLEDVTVRLGDTAISSFGFGAFASRQGVIGGGAALLAARAVRDKARQIAAHLLQVGPDDLALERGQFYVQSEPARRLSLAEVARAAFYQASRLPPGMEPGLEATRYYDPVFGTMSGGCQVAVVEVEPESGRIWLRRHLCVEDGGCLINPLIVHGQICGAIAQGIGGALYEHIRYDESGQMLTVSLMDYHIPTAAEIPWLEIEHVEFPSPTTLGGLRGVGESGTLGAPAAIANAVADALAPLGVRVTELPLTPARVRALVRAAGR